MAKIKHFTFIAILLHGYCVAQVCPSRLSPGNEVRKWSRDGFIRIKGHVIDLVSIPDGQFLMGSNSNEPGYLEHEGPIHNVSIRKFYMSKHEVSHGIFEHVTNGVFIQEGEKSVVPALVTWEEAVDFCEIVSCSTSFTVSLPTEAQWEYACRGSTSSAFNFGSTISITRANFSPNTSRAVDLPLLFHSSESSLAGYVSVYSYWPNSYGLHHMHGNASEWCRDIYDPAFYKRSGKDDPMCFERKGNPDFSGRVIRGGAYWSRASKCRSASRDWLTTKGTTTGVAGFRVVVRRDGPQAP